MNLLFLLPFCILCAIPDSSKTLLAVVNTVRHGARTPKDLKPRFTEGLWWKDGPNELTLAGERQQFIMGEKFRRRYVDEMKFLEGRMNPNDVYVLTSPTNRTSMSA